jgi:hypothetical protein
VLAHEVPQEGFAVLEETVIQEDLYCHAVKLIEEI